MRDLRALLAAVERGAAGRGGGGKDGKDGGGKDVKDGKSEATTEDLFSSVEPLRLGSAAALQRAAAAGLVSRHRGGGGGTL